MPSDTPASAQSLSDEFRIHQMAASIAGREGARAEEDLGAMAQARLMRMGASLRKAAENGASTDEIVRTARLLASRWKPSTHADAAVATNPALSAAFLEEHVVACPERDLLIAGRRLIDTTIAATFGPASAAATNGTDAQVLEDLDALVDAAGRAFILTSGVLPFNMLDMDPLLLAAWRLASVAPAGRLAAACRARPAAAVGLIGMAIWAGDFGWRDGVLGDALAAAPALPSGPSELDRMMCAASLATLELGLRRSRSQHAGSLQKRIDALTTPCIEPLPTSLRKVVLHSMRRVLVESCITSQNYAAALKHGRQLYDKAHPTARGQRELAWQLAVVAVLLGRDSEAANLWAKAETPNGELGLIYGDDLVTPAPLQALLRERAPHLAPGLTDEERRAAAAAAAAAATAQAAAAMKDVRTVAGDNVETVVTKAQAKKVAAAGALVEAGAGKSGDELNEVD